MASEKTAEIVRYIRNLKAGDKIAPVILTYVFGRTNHVSVAIRIAKEFGYIEVAYMGCTGTPVYQRTGIALLAE